MAERPPSQPPSRSWTLPEQLPATFGRYQLVRLLGQGGMGTVYLAHDSKLDRQVALKIPQFRTDDGPSVMKRFFREARAAATLHHANICPVHDVGEINGTHYLTMAHIEGRPLSELIRSNAKAILPRHAAALVRKLALALDEAHRKNVIHRDLKPANVMLNRRGEPVIMDFGLARRGSPKDTRLTQYGAVMGTPAYMAPEQAKGVPEDMGPACDMYSLGVILYELLVGRTPFEGDTMAVLSQLLMDEPEPPSAYRPDLDRNLEAICLKAMAKRPEARYRSMGELAGALTEYLKATSQPTHGGAAQTHPAPEMPLAEMLRELEPPPAAEPSVATGSRVSRLGGRRSVAQLPQDFHLSREEAALPRMTRKAVRSNGRFSPRLWIAITAGAAALILAGIVILVRTKNGTIQIELSDSSAKIEVKVDGDTIDITGLGQPLRLKPGKHNILVQGKDFETASESFTVKEGDNPVLRVTLIPKPAVAAAGPVPPAAKSPEPSPPAKPVETPPPEPSPPAKPVETPPQEPTKPVADAKAFNGHAYKFFGEQLTWKEAKAKCASLGGHLVIIDSAEENKFVAELIAKAAWEDAWIGATDEAQEGNWRAVDGKPLSYTNWFPGQPNNKNNEEQYALMSNRTFGATALNWQWSDQPNESKQHQPGFVCEWDSASTEAMSKPAGTPVPSSQPPNPVKPAGGQLVLFDGKDLSAWMHADRQPAKWKVADGYFEITGDGNLLTREEFAGDHQIHVEFWIPPSPAKVKGQARGNTGVYVQGRYEIQILDSYGVSPPTKQDCGALYGQVAPLVNACKPPGTWQTMDITFRAPKVDGQGNVIQKPRVSVLLNDTTVLNNVEIEKVSPGAVNPAMDKPGPLLLQDHGNPVRFRNVWVNAALPPSDRAAEVKAAPNGSAKSAFKAGQVWEGSYQPGRNQDFPFRLKITKVDARKFVADFYFLQFGVEGHGSEMAGEFRDSEHFDATFTRRIRGTWIEESLKDGKLEGAVTKESLTGTWTIPSPTSNSRFTGRLAESEKQRPKSAAASTRPPELNDRTFAKWRDYIAPKAEELTWLQIPWQATFWDAVVEAQQKDKPIVVWAMSGDPLGCV